MKILALSLLLICPIARLSAQEATKLYLETVDGRQEHVQPLSLDGDKARYRVFVLGGEMTTTRRLSDFTPESAFAFESAVTAPKTFDQHFALAKKAASLGLLPQAGTSARAAISVVKGSANEKEQVGEVRSWGADIVEAKCNEAIAQKDVKTAQRALGILTSRLADQRTDEQLAALSAAVETLEVAANEAKESARQKKLDDKTREALQRKLKPIREKVAQGDKLASQGLAKSRNTSQSAKLSEQSIDAYKSAWKGLEDLSKQLENDAELASEASELASHIHDNGIRAALHAANMLTVQSDYKGALDWTARILKFDPTNDDARSMMQTIQLAEAEASESWRWNWHVVGDRPRPRK
ncbi:MAG: hypothetical protein ABL997_07205 [Planctomycetota bacterium]